GWSCCRRSGSATAGRGRRARRGRRSPAGRASARRRAAGLSTTSVGGAARVVLDDDMYGRRYLYCRGTPELLFTENETNARRLFPKGVNDTPFVKDGINDCVVNGARAAGNPAH